ncbi:hypothetical protein QYM36_006740 [Artemia franciscana]|uniref:H15 domain-containing protein n=1 Tax=Artemia franciscana TaxID=6661 RepID=A0AA88LE04_ARTSF|nr:hypothetical protein QYM36_006740 [Artemia franciscana]
MITKSFADLKERGGPSRQAILKYIKGNLQVGNDTKVVNMHLKQALKRCLANRIVIIPKISLESEDERSGPNSTGNIDSDSQLVHTTVPRDAKKAKQSYKQSYRKEWPSVPELKAWLSQNEAKTEAYCLYCDTDIKVDFGKTALVNHEKTQKHKDNEVRWLASMKGQLKISSSLSGSSFVHQVEEVETKLVSFIIQNNLPFSISENLVSLVKSLPGAGQAVQYIQLGKQKATNCIRQGFGPFFKDLIVEKLKTSQLSIIIDETTDQSTKKHLAVCVSFCNENLETQIDVLNVTECANGTAITLFQKMEESISKLTIAGLPNWIGYCSDTTNLMFGIHRPVVSMIQDKYPWVIPVKCTGHLCHLSASNACKKMFAGPSTIISTRVQ